MVGTEPLASRKESPSTLISVSLSFSNAGAHLMVKRVRHLQMHSRQFDVGCTATFTLFFQQCFLHAISIAGAILGSEDTKMKKYVPDIEEYLCHCGDKSSLLH